MDSSQKLHILDELLGETLALKSLTRKDESRLDLHLQMTRMKIKNVCGESSDYLKDLSRISFIPPSLTYDDRSDIVFWNSGLSKLENLLTTIRQDIVLTAQSDTPNLPATNIPLSNKVFIVHGHDEAMKQAVARTLEKLELDTIILHEKPNQGRTIIEKFSDYANVRFAVVLLSPDDIGYSVKDGPDKAKTRARQNVILELGFFLGKIGRGHVVALHPQDRNFEFPSDYDGVVYIRYDELSDGWKYELVRELQACGFDADANILTKPI